MAEIPAAIVLLRLPVPVLGVTDDGTIVFANEAFCDMVGYPVAEAATLNLGDIFPAAANGGSAVAVLRAYANQVTDLLNEDGSRVRARMSASALLRDDDEMVVVAFNDLTEQLWERGSRGPD